MTDSDWVDLIHGLCLQTVHVEHALKVGILGQENDLDHSVVGLGLPSIEAASERVNFRDTEKVLIDEVAQSMERVGPDQGEVVVGDTCLRVVVILFGVDKVMRDIVQLGDEWDVFGQFSLAIAGRRRESWGGWSLKATTVVTLGHGIRKELTEIEKCRRVNDQWFQLGAVLFYLVLVLVEESVQNKVSEEQRPLALNVLKYLELMSVVVETGIVYREVDKSRQLGCCFWTDEEIMV